MILEVTDLYKTIKLLKEGYILALPTDTVYGLHCKYNDKNTKLKISHLKKRDEEMPFITLVGNVSQLNELGVITNFYQQNIIKKMWPGPNTLVFDTDTNEYSKDMTVSVRLPDNQYLLNILKETGPLVSSSANTHGNPPAKSVQEAIKYFGKELGYYVDGGILDNKPSNIYRLYEAHLEQIR